MNLSHSNQPAPRTIIHLGARQGERCQEFRNRGAEQIVLVEAESGMVADLHRRFGGQDGIHIVAATSGMRDSRAALSTMSLPALNSLAEPLPALSALYPGLRLVRQQQVDVLSPHSLLRGVDLEIRPILLVIETAGQELATLEALRAADLLERIDFLELRCGEEPFYADAGDRAGIEAWLAAEGFALTGRDLDDPDWPILHLRLDHVARALTRAEAQIVILEQAAEAKASTLSETEAKLQAATDRATAADRALAEAHSAAEANANTLRETEAKLKAANDRATAADTALAAARAAAEAKASALSETEAKLQAANDRATAADTALAEAHSVTEAKASALSETETKLKAATDRATAADRALAEAHSVAEAKASALSETETKLKVATDRAIAADRALAEAHSAAEAKASALSETETKLKAANDRATTADKIAAQLRSQIALLGEETARDQHDLRSTRQDLGLALRLQTRLQAELRGLQERYATTYSEKSEQEALLRQLTPHLREAAQQLQALSLLEAEVSHAPLPTPRSGKISKSRKR